MEPRFALIEMNGCTYVFIDGKFISDGIKDITYHARNENGELKPTVDMTFYVKDFSFESDKTLEDFLKETMKKGENLKLK